MNQNDIYNLNRFVKAQDYSYDSAVKELKNGRKTSHWMWYIFPQIRGLGMSDISYEYDITGLDEAREYFKHDILCPRLVELCNILLGLKSNDASDIFGYPDDMKLRSSMTLFYIATNEKIFMDVLDKFFDGKLDERTISILKSNKEY